MTNSIVYKFIPSSLLQALGWSWLVEGYSWKQAWRKAPLELPDTAIKNCISSARAGSFLVTFEGKYLNQLPVGKLPEGWAHPLDSGKTPWETVRQSAWEYLKNIHRRSVVATFVAVFLFAGYILTLLKHAVAAQVADRGWFVTTGCNAYCVQKAVSVHFIALLLLISAVLPLFWSLWFLRRNLDGVRQFSARRQMQGEALLLSCLSLATFFYLAIHLHNSRYLDLLWKH